MLGNLLYNLSNLLNSLMKIFPCASEHIKGGFYLVIQKFKCTSHKLRIAILNAYVVLKCVVSRTPIP